MLKVIYIHGNFLTGFQFYNYFTFEDVLPYNLAAALRSVYHLAALRYVPFHILIYFEFKCQATHQSAAQAGYLLRVQRHTLFFGHLHGNTVKIENEICAAYFPATNPQPLHHPGLMPGANLPQLDPYFETLNQIFHKLPEINPAFGGEIKYYLAFIKQAFHLNQLHGEFPFSDLLQTELTGLLLHYLIFFFRFQVIIRCLTDDVFQPNGQFINWYRLYLHDNCAQGRAIFRIDDHLFILFQREIGGIETVYLPVFSKSYSNNIFQSALLLLLVIYCEIRSFKVS
jgi:hypothetical protein